MKKIIIIISIIAISAAIILPITLHKNQASAVYYVHEIGDDQFITDNDPNLHIYISYPKIGIENIDNEISNWANALSQNTSANVELNVQYNSYKISDRFISIEEIIYENGPNLDDITQSVKIFNVDTISQKLISNNEILDSENSKVLDLLKKKIEKNNKNIDKNLLNSINKDWLNNIILTKSGVKVILPDYTSINLSKKELGKSYLLNNLPITSPAPAPANNAPTPTSAPVSNEIFLDDAPQGAMVALTFDDGPTEYTKQILATLKQYNAKATFCVLGNRVEANADIIKEMDAQGCQVIGHSWDHKLLTKLSSDAIRKDMQNTNAAIKKVIGKDPIMFRAPYGEVNDAVSTIAWEMNMSLVNWNVDTNDWRSKNANTVYNYIIAHVQNNSIILSHDIFKSTADAMAQVIPELTQKGYKLVTVSELLGDTTPGKVYRVKK